MTEPRLVRALEALYGKPPPSVRLVQLQGDASTRRYFRASIAEAPAGLPEALIVMQLPSDAFASDEGGSQPETSRLPFLEVAELLESLGLPVPKIYARDLDVGVVLLEDLGDLTMHEKLGCTPRTEWPALYGQAVDLLAELHERCADLPAQSVVARRRFDRALLEWELEHFREWGLRALFGELDPREETMLDEAFATIVDQIETMPVGFVHRDYQSKNLMVRPTGALALIDFQDALIGPRVYDLVALLCDSYVPLDPTLQATMIDRYAALRHIDRDSLRREFDWVAIHRKLKDAGRFVYIDRVRGNPSFLRWFPQSLVYVARAVAQIGQLDALSEVLERRISGFPDRVALPPPSRE